MGGHRKISEVGKKLGKGKLSYANRHLISTGKVNVKLGINNTTLIMPMIVQSRAFDAVVKSASYSVYSNIRPTQL